MPKQSDKTLLRKDVETELNQSRAAYLEACLEWAAHPCPAHLYNLELFKSQLGETFEKVKRAGLMPDLVHNLHPDPVFSAYLATEESEKAASSFVERRLRSALASTSQVVVKLNAQGWLTPSSPSLEAYQLLFKGLALWRRRLLEQGVTYPRGFSPGCCQVRDAEDSVLRADIVVRRLLDV